MPIRTIRSLLLIVVACLLFSSQTYGQTDTSTFRIQDSPSEQLSRQQQPANVTIELLVSGRVIARANPAHNGMRKSPEVEFPHVDAEYTIRISNRSRYRPMGAFPSSRRILVDVMVDGLSVMDGQPGSRRVKGYIVSPGRSCNIQGWRVSDSEVKRFVVCRPKESLAAEKGTSNQIGKIQIVIYREWTPPIKNTNPQIPTISTRSNSQNIGQSLAQAAGTKQGGSVASRVKRIPFRPGTIAGKVTFKYHVAGDNDKKQVVKNQ